MVAKSDVIKIQKLHLKLQYINGIAQSILMGLTTKLILKEMGKEKFNLKDELKERNIVQEAYDIAEQMYEEKERRQEAIAIASGYKIEELNNISVSQTGFLML